MEFGNSQTAKNIYFGIVYWSNNGKTYYYTYSAQEKKQAIEKYQELPQKRTKILLYAKVIYGKSPHDIEMIVGLRTNVDVYEKEYQALKRMAKKQSPKLYI